MSDEQEFDRRSVDVENLNYGNYDKYLESLSTKSDVEKIIICDMDFSFLNYNGPIDSDENHSSELFKDLPFPGYKNAKFKRTSTFGEVTNKILEREAVGDQRYGRFRMGALQFFKKIHDNKSKEKDSQPKIWAPYVANLFTRGLHADELTLKPEDAAPHFIAYQNLVKDLKNYKVFIVTKGPAQVVREYMQQLLHEKNNSDGVPLYNNLEILGTEFEIKNKNKKIRKKNGDGSFKTVKKEVPVLAGLKKYDSEIKNDYSIVNKVTLRGGSKIDVYDLIESGAFDGEKYRIIGYWGDTDSHPASEKKKAIMGDAPLNSKNFSIFHHIDRKTGEYSAFLIKPEGEREKLENYTPLSPETYTQKVVTGCEN